MKNIFTNIFSLNVFFTLIAIYNLIFNFWHIILEILHNIGNIIKNTTDKRESQKLQCNKMFDNAKLNFNPLYFDISNTFHL